MNFLYDYDTINRLCVNYDPINCLSVNYDTINCLSVKYDTKENPIIRLTYEQLNIYTANLWTTKDLYASLNLKKMGPKNI